MKLIVRKRELYGRVVYYPVNEVATIFAAIAETKTLTGATLNLIQQGLKLEVELAPEVFS